MTTDDDHQCPHMLHLGTRGWGLALRCTLNRGHRGVHVGPVYATPSSERHVLAEGITAIEWRADNLDAPDVAGGSLISRGGTFPGTDLDLDLLTAIVRIQQIEREGIDTCGGVIWHRILTCDVPRLLRYVAPAALEWSEGTPWNPLKQGT